MAPAVKSVAVGLAIVAIVTLLVLAAVSRGALPSGAAAVS